MSKLKVLYVDDELINLMLFKANLERKYHILTANNGLSGLEILSDNKDITIVISDMKMPNINGIEFIRKAKKILPTAIYYILSGFEVTDEIQNALDDSLIRKYLKKPFNMNEISIEIEQAVRKGDH